MVKDNIVFADVHASFDDDFSDVYLTQSDYDLVAAATRKSVRPTQAAFDRHIGAVDRRYQSHVLLLKPIHSQPAPFSRNQRRTQN
nr:uncharacterized protein LOC125972261 isoform X2 [Syngnathus scovelli]